jgi:hypothetical protein
MELHRRDMSPMEIGWGIATFIAGSFAGWFGHTFMRDPISEFSRLRQAGYEAVLKHTNTGPLPAGHSENHEARQRRRERIATGREELLELSQKLRAFAAHWSLLSDPLGWLGFDLNRAAQALAGLGNRLDGWSSDRAKLITAFRRSLKFKDK